MSKSALPSSNIKSVEQGEKQTKDEIIYQQIYSAIIDHQLAPDTKLPEDALAESFNVSRTIIRKVLLGLSHEGLVTTAPKRGARVAKPSIREGKEIFEARRIIEVASLPYIIQHIDDDEFKALEVLNKQQLAAQNAQDLIKAIRFSGDFHLALMRASNNNSLYEYLRTLISRSSLIVAVYGSTQKHLPSCQGHLELLRLIKEKNIEQCQQWMNDHLVDIEASLDFSEPKKDDPDFKVLFAK